MDDRLRRDLPSVYLAGIAAARVLGSDRLRTELALADQSILLPNWRQSIDTTWTDLGRAKQATLGLTALWAAKLANGASKPEALAALQSRLETGAITETAVAFGDARRRAVAAVRSPVELIRVWNATLDKLTCSVCAGADGSWVELGARFRLGEPGSVHPRCRCYDEIVPRSWVEWTDRAET